jgi:hypothetical protein
MVLFIDGGSIPLLEHEYLEYHDGREGFPFNLDASICGIKDKRRAEELQIVFTALYPFVAYKMESIQILETKAGFELLFAMSDFCIVVKEVKQK